jgi:hypothetical protein
MWTIYKRGNGPLGIYIHKLKDQQKRTTRKGRNPLDDVNVEIPDTWFSWLGLKEKKCLWGTFPTYDWVKNDGRQNIPIWIENVARIAGS